jgi:hypothetical protein
MRRPMGIDVSLTMPSDAGTEDAIVERLFSAGLDVDTALRLARDDTPMATLLHEAIELLDRAVQRARSEAIGRQSPQEPPRVESVH